MIDLKKEQLLSAQEAGDLLGLTEKTIRNWMLDGLHGVRLETRKIGGTVRTSVEALDRFEVAVEAARAKNVAAARAKAEAEAAAEEAETEAPA